MNKENNNSRIFLFTESGKPIMPIKTEPTESETTPVSQKIRRTARIRTSPISRPIAKPVETSTKATLPTRKRGRPRKSETSKRKGKASKKPDEPKRKRGRPRKHPVKPNVASASTSEPDSPGQSDPYYDEIYNLQTVVAKMWINVGNIKKDNEVKDQRIKTLEEEVDRMKLHLMGQHRN
jgi:hypothetical protein